MKGVQELLAFNRGRISRLGMARVDLKRTALSAAIQTNWMPRVLGSMMLRPGLGYINTEPGVTRNLPFVFSNNDTALVELHDQSVTFTVDDVRLTRQAVSASITNGEFTTDLSGWTNSIAAPTTWVTGGGAKFVASGSDTASLSQGVTTASPNVEHGLRVVVARGSLSVRVVSILATDYIQAELGVGEHSLAFTPTGNFVVVFYNQTERPAVLSSAEFESGEVTLSTPWDESALPYVRARQSGDVFFVADGMHQQRRISRTGARSWSVDLYAPIDGPFLIENTSETTIEASAISGDVTLTSSGDTTTNGVFRPEHVGALFSLSSIGQTVSSSFTAQNQFSNSIRVTGVGAARAFSIVITGTFTATVTLQYSTDDTTWVDRATYTTATSTSLTDGLDNQIIYYRLGVKTGNYTSGTAVSTLSYAAGSITGVVRILTYTSPVSVTAEVLKDLGGTAATNVWAEGAWSDYRGWPSSVSFHDGRLFWAGRDNFWGSVTDQFYTFDSGFEGDAGPISRSVGYGPVDSVNWLESLNRLIAGTDGAVIECKSTSLDEPLTPTNFTPKTAATRGCARVDTVKIDTTALFVQSGGTRVFEIDNSIGPNGGVLSNVTDTTVLVPEVCAAGVARIAVQRQPDTRVHCVLDDGTAAVLIWDRAEDVRCWIDIETDGLIEDVCVLPGTEEDVVYYVVKRTIDGSEVRYLEKWAMESECRGAAINKLADSFVYAAEASNVITGLDHLEGEEVVAWGGGIDLGTFTVSGGSITLHASTTYTHRCAGLGYQARFKSTKLAYSMQGRSALTLKKLLERLGVVLVDTHPRGLEFGPSFDRLDPLPETDRYGELDMDEVFDEFDSEAFMFPGSWDTDSRLCLVANAPRACTVLAAAIELETKVR